jgi:hypothetical protein
MFCIACVVAWVLALIWIFIEYIKCGNERLIVGNTTTTTGAAATGLPPGVPVPPPIIPVNYASGAVGNANDNVQKLIALIENYSRWQYTDKTTGQPAVISFKINSGDQTKINISNQVGGLDMFDPTITCMWDQVDANTIQILKPEVDATTYSFIVQYLSPTYLRIIESMNLGPKGQLTYVNYPSLLS